MRGWSLVLTVVAATLSACQSSTVPAGPVPVVEFTASVTRTLGQDEISVSAGPRQLIVRGFLWTGGGGYILQAKAERPVDRRYVLTIMARQTEAGIAIPVQHSYIARLRDLPPGRHALQINYQVDGRSEVVLEREVSVEP